MSKDFKGVLEVRTEVTHFVLVMNNKKYSHVYYESHLQIFCGEKKIFNKKINVFRLSNRKAQVLQFADQAGNS